MQTALMCVYVCMYIKQILTQLKGEKDCNTKKRLSRGL